jgi:hypothetical protein
MSVPTRGPFRRSQSSLEIPIEDRTANRGAVIAMFLAATFGMMALLSFPLGRLAPEIGRLLRPPASVGGLEPILRPVTGTLVLPNLVGSAIHPANAANVAPDALSLTPVTARAGGPGHKPPKKDRHDANHPKANRFVKTLESRFNVPPGVTTTVGPKLVGRIQSAAGNSKFVHPDPAAIRRAVNSVAGLVHKKHQGR